MKGKSLKTTLLTSILGLILSIVSPSVLSVHATIQEEQVAVTPEKNSSTYMYLHILYKIW